MSFISSRISKYLSRYFDYRLVFVMDFLLSVASSAIVLLSLGYFGGQIYRTTQFIATWMLSGTVAIIAALLIVRSYRIIIRHSSMQDFGRITLGVLIKTTISACIVAIFFEGISNGITIGLIADFFITIFLFLGVRFIMLVAYEFFKKRFNSVSDRQRLLVYGTSDKSVATITRLQYSTHWSVVGLIVPGNRKIASIGSLDINSPNLTIAEKTVYCYDSEEEFKTIVADLDVKNILFASEKDVNTEKDSLVKMCLRGGIKTLVTPTVEEIIDGKVMQKKVREVQIEDLLCRDEIKISMDAIKENIGGKVIMVTGAAGSIGSELCRQLAGFGVRKLIMFDNAETPMHNIRLELEELYPDLEFVPMIGDVRLVNRLDYAFRKYRPQIVFHAAAYKHVPLMEENPCEAVLVNVCGSRNVADKCLEYDAEKMVMISTDKAVNPTNIMGCTKRLAEIYVQSLGLAVEKGIKPGKTKFVTTRFGNVLGSNGSVIPRFREQIAKGGPVTVTHREITRFFMTIPEACRLVMEAATLTVGNQIFVFDMGEAVKIYDLAKNMIELAGLKLGTDINIVCTGLRPGEKLYEEVLSTKENTQPTTHERIRIASVREYPYQDAADTINRLETLSRDVNIPDMVVLMKQTVPEFISKNSRFEMFDNVEHSIVEN